MQMDDQAFDQALATLNRVRERNPRHGQVLKLLAALHWRQKDWPALKALLPELRAAPMLPVDKINRWTVDAFSALLGQPDLDESTIGKLWEEVPKGLRREPALLRARIGALVRAGALAVAEAEIRRALRDDWDPALILMYGELPLPDASQQLKSAETFLRERPEDPDLLLAVGRLSFRNQLWGKARSYLETSLAVRPAVETWQALGRLMDKIGEKEAAAKAWQKGLEMARSSALSVAETRQAHRPQRLPDRISETESPAPSA
jgi:HemY protein